MEANAGEYIKKYLHLKRFPRISLHCKLVPVQYREYEYGLFQRIQYVKISISYSLSWYKDNIISLFNTNWELVTFQPHIIIAQLVI